MTLRHNTIRRNPPDEW